MSPELDLDDVFKDFDDEKESSTNESIEKEQKQEDQTQKTNLDEKDYRELQESLKKLREQGYEVNLRASAEELKQQIKDIQSGKIAKSQGTKSESTDNNSVEPNDSIPDDFNLDFEVVVPESTGLKSEQPTDNKIEDKIVDQGKVVAGHQTGEYNNTGICMNCNTAKNNISGGSGYCYECDYPQKEKEPVSKDIEPKIQASSSRVSVPKFKAPTEADIDALLNSAVPENREYNDSEMDSLEDRTIFAIIGDKGAGKTTLAYSLNKDELDNNDPRKINPFTKERQATVIGCVSLDKQGIKNAKKYRKALWAKYPEKAELVKLRGNAVPTKDELINRKEPYEWADSIRIVNEYMKNTPKEDWGYIHTKYGVKQIKEIHVWNGVRYYIKEPALLKLKSADTSFEYLKHLLDNVISKIQPDYIILDASAKLKEIAENTMRWRNDLGHTQGIANANIWKERNDYMDHIIDRCILYSLVSPVFTFFFKMQKVKDKDTGETYVKEPEWVGRIKEESNIVIHLDDRMEQGIHKWYGYCQSPKDTGWRIDETDVYTDMCGNGGINNLLTKNEVFSKSKEEI